MWNVLEFIKAACIVLLITSKESNALSFVEIIHKLCDDSIKPLSESAVDLLLEKTTSHLNNQYSCKNTKTDYPDFSICINKTVFIVSLYQFNCTNLCINILHSIFIMHQIFNVLNFL